MKIITKREKNICIITQNLKKIVLINITLVRFLITSPTVLSLARLQS